MTESPEVPGARDVPDSPRHYTWPKYVLGAVALFFTVCTWWTVKEVRRLQRAKADGMELPSSSLPTNPPPPQAAPR